MSEVDFVAYTPASWTRTDLEAAGFTGFVTFDELGKRGATRSAGIYVVLREATNPPSFLPQSPAGRKKDFTETIDKLNASWVNGAEVLYIGRAKRGGRSDGIHRRLKQYRRTGLGTADNHSGGVWIFQLADAAQLKVCWRVVEDDSDGFVTALEHYLIADFAARPEYQCRPFANRQD